MESIEFEVDGQTLRGNFYKPKGKDKGLAFLFLHGWTGNPNEPAAELLAQNGFSAMTINLRGHNSSDGDINALTIADFLKDVTAGYDYFKDAIGPDCKIALVGNSFGSYLGIMLSKTRPVTALSLRVPANYRDEDFEMSKMANSGSDNPKVVEWREKKLSVSQNQALAALNSFKGNIQIIEAENDEVVSHQTVQNYVDAIADKSQLEYHFMKGWPHSMGDDPVRNQQFQQLLLTWANKL